MIVFIMCDVEDVHPWITPDDVGWGVAGEMMMGSGSVVVRDVRLQGLRQFKLGHRIGVRVTVASAEQRSPYGLAAQLLQRVRLHPLG